MPTAAAQPAYADFVHTGLDSLAGRYMRMFWHPLYRSEDLAPGWVVPIKVMSEEFTLYRGESGEPHVVAFRCAHRGTQLSAGWVEGDNLRCFYHGWVYDGTGQCIEQPAEPEPFCQKIRIRSYPTQEYLGLIFAYLGAGEPPPLPRYPDFEREGVLQTRTYTRACNYFNDIDNDPIHGAFVHRGGRPRPIPRVAAEETEWGMAISQTYPGGLVRVSHRGMPNMNHVLSPPRGPEATWSNTIHWKVPIDDETERSFTVYLTNLTGEAANRYRERRAAWLATARIPAPELSEAILTGKMRVEDTFTLTDIDHATVEDDVAQIGQGAIADREQERLAPTDVSVILFRKLWQRELRALAEGRPLKQWVRTERLMASDEAGPTQQRASGRRAGSST